MTNREPTLADLADIYDDAKRALAVALDEWAYWDTEVVEGRKQIQKLKLIANSWITQKVTEQEERQ